MSFKINKIFYKIIQKYSAIKINIKKISKTKMKINSK